MPEREIANTKIDSEASARCLIGIIVAQEGFAGSPPVPSRSGLRLEVAPGFRRDSSINPQNIMLCLHMERCSVPTMGMEVHHAVSGYVFAGGWDLWLSGDVVRCAGNGADIDSRRDCGTDECA